MLLYHLSAIFCCKGLLTWRHFVSRLNKGFMLYGLYLIVMTFVWRLDSPGKICSGDDLTSDEKDSELISERYLLFTGKVLWIYCIIVWVFLGLACIGGGFMGYSAYKMFT